jgi:hypothetical protein
LVVRSIHRASRLQLFERAAFAGHDGFDMIGPWKGGEENLRVSGAARSRRAGRRADGVNLFEGGRIKIEGGNRIAGLHQSLAHGAAHIAQSDKADARQGRHVSISPIVWVKGRPLPMAA